MQLIQQITSNPLQSQSLILSNGIALNLTLYFRPMQNAWWIEQLVYQTFTLNGLKISNSPNMLQQFCNQLPFGIGCFSTANREPSQADDFSSGASNLYILSAAEVAQYTEFLQGG